MDDRIGSASRPASPVGIGPFFKPRAIAEQVSLVLLVIAFLAIVLWQRFENDRGPRITTAVELSLINFSDPVLVESKRRYVEYSSLVANDRPGNMLTLLAARAYLDYLEYVASLLNSGRIDEDYVSRAVLCDVYEAHFALTTTDKLDGWRGKYRRVSDLDAYSPSRHVKGLCG